MLTQCVKKRSCSVRRRRQPRHVLLPSRILRLDKGNSEARLTCLDKVLSIFVSCKSILRNGRGVRIVCQIRLSFERSTKMVFVAATEVRSQI